MLQANANATTSAWNISFGEVWGLFAFSDGASKINP
jgi:hypothetical protein